MGRGTDRTKHEQRQIKTMRDGAGHAEEEHHQQTLKRENQIKIKKSQGNMVLGNMERSVSQELGTRHETKMETTRSIGTGQVFVRHGALYKQASPARKYEAPVQILPLSPSQLFGTKYA